ncbi:type VI secretion system baseplate subunit TssE [Dyella sp.]|uniref:type VI secretion system baseplate subunit TssE n=1 Tax=Dyella sp. TaxID=1869338 RepID=UPI002B45F4D6|nr:type VI secretion system baseplate subunit TssE [Dyella sp.]HKT27475.1 type VI secretion system baseplate subunit TssE [Dyella sp.]
MNASDARNRQAYMPSLLDRLLDDQPGRQTEPPSAYAPDAEGMRRIVRRDLGLLLNTTNLHDEIEPERYPIAAASVINYGIPALAGGYVSDLTWHMLERRVRTAITHFEPRLIPESLHIKPVDDKAPIHYNKLAFQIHGLVRWAPYPLEFRIQSMLDVETNAITFVSTQAGVN